MQNLTQQQIAGYFDGTLAPGEQKRVERHLEAHPEEMAALEPFQFSLGALREWDEAEPLRASEQLWPRVRLAVEQGPHPRRSAWSTALNRMRALFAVPSRTRLSVGVAMATVVIAMGAMLFGPQHATHSAQAMTESDVAFVQLAVARHADYVRHPAHPGDVASYETGADENASDNTPGE